MTFLKIVKRITKEIEPLRKKGESNEVFYNRIRLEIAHEIAKVDIKTESMRASRAKQRRMK